MPILSPQIQEALRESGLLTAPKETIHETLDDAGLSLEATLSVAEQIMQHGSSDAVRGQMVRTSLQLRGLMKDERQPLPSITIVINDPESKFKVNPILVPREISL